MRNVLFIFGFFSLTFLAHAQKVSTIILEPFMITQNYEHFKRLVLNTSNYNVEYINGFDFDWGSYYVLEVEENKISPLSDGTEFEHDLIKVVSKKSVNDSFVFLMSVDPLRYYSLIDEPNIENYTLNIINDTVYKYMNEIEIEIPNEINQSFKKQTDNLKSVTGKFKFLSKDRIRLIQLY
jgi:hypothetical protein